MQTFLPDTSFALSAQRLDNKRLGKQRVEVYQMLRTIMGITKGWCNHPCVRMWRDYPEALAYYGHIVCEAWTSRGYIDNTNKKIQALVPIGRGVTMPPWWSDDTERLRIITSHRRNLIRKFPSYYGAFWPELQPADKYYWPI